MREKKIILPKLYDCGKDISKQWFIYYSYLDDHTKKMVVFRVYKGFNKYDSIKEKRRHARRLIDKYTKLLKNGWNPFDAETEVIYKNNLAYEIAGKLEKKKAKKTLSYYISVFLEEKRKSIAHESYKTYQSQLRYFNDFITLKRLANKSIVHFEEKHAKEFFDYLENSKKLAGKTLNKYRNLLSSIWNYFGEENILIQNVFKKIKKYKEYTVAQKPIKPNVMELLKDELERNDPQLWLAAEFQYYCFIRPKELRLMKIGDIDLFDGRVTLRSDTTKNSKTRIVDIPIHFNKKLFTHYKLNDYPENFYVFSLEQKPSARKVGKNYFWSRFDAIRKKLNIPKDYKFYGFKHTGAVVALKEGANIKDIQQQMGHHSLEVTDEYLKSRVGYESDFFKKKLPPI